MGNEKVEVFIREQRVKLHFREQPGSPEELQSILKKIGECGICMGGPRFTSYPNKYSESGFKDGIVWRHKKCSIVLEGGQICINCLKLHKSFPDPMEDTFNINRKRRRTIGLTPTSRKIANEQRAGKRQCKQVITRQAGIIGNLKADIETLIDKLKEVKEKSVMKELKRGGIPNNPVKNI